MMTLIKKKKKILIWCLIYLIFVYTTYIVSIIQQGRCFDEFLVGNLFIPQKYFFDISILFISYLYVVKKPFHSIFFVARCKESYLLHIVLYGLKASLFYIVYTVVLFIGIPFLNGIPIQYSGSLFFDFLNLFSFLFATYLIYILILLLSGKQMLAVLSCAVINIGLLIIYFSLGMIGQSLAMGIETFLLTSYTGIAVVLVGLIFIIFRRRDFLL